MRVALYGRVSTAHGQNPEMQMAELREFAGKRGWAIAGEFVDVGVSGSKDRRPQLDAMINAARTSKLDAILCWKLDRFGRSLKHLVNALDELESLGVAFIALRDNLDLTTPSGRLMFHVIAAMAQFERSLIQERVKSGLAAARARGKVLGRPKVTVDARKIASLRRSGGSWRKIGRELGIAAATAKRIARSR
ncbi:MAG TPA: recombinase family protein [Candidatus Acidoferrales bacterium]|nr:recombinase family protein [Candidatus Acidoferrales bacterium]